MTEEEVKLNYITPAIENAGWDKKQIRMEYPITAGKIIVRGNKGYRQRKKFADYLLMYKGDSMPLAVVEAKDDSHNFGDWMLDLYLLLMVMDSFFMIWKQANKKN